MKALWSKPLQTGVLFFCFIVWTNQPLNATARTGINWEDIILSPNSRTDMTQVLRTGVPDLEGQIRQYMKDNIEKLKQISKELEDKTWAKAGMTYEITLAGTKETGKVSLVYDVMDLAAWDGKSDLPVKLKIDKEEVGAVEVQYDPASPLKIKEIKVEKSMPGNVSQSGTLSIEGTWEKPEVKISYGQKAETPTAGGFKGEAEQSIGLDFSRSADDLYDPEWTPRSEWMVVRGVEDIISKIDWGIKFGGKKETEIAPGEKITVGVDVTVNTDRIRSWWTDRLFSDMYEAYDRLDESLDRATEWRRKKIEEEALHLGINPGGKTNAELINEIQAIWNENPELRRPIFRAPKPPVTEASEGGTSSGGGAGASWDEVPGGVSLGDPGTHSADLPGVPLASPDTDSTSTHDAKTDEIHPEWQKVHPDWQKVHPDWQKVHPDWSK